jgi:TPR repeat protein
MLTGGFMEINIGSTRVNILDTDQVQQAKVKPQSSVKSWILNILGINKVPENVSDLTQKLNKSVSDLTTAIQKKEKLSPSERTEVNAALVKLKNVAGILKSYTSDSSVEARLSILTKITEHQAVFDQFDDITRVLLNKDAATPEELASAKDQLIALTKRKDLAPTIKSRAMHQLARCYTHGFGVDKDFSKAFTLYENASKLGYAKAKNSLAICYENGHGTEPNLEKALALYEEAANLGDPTAKINLAIHYEEATPPNYKKAFQLYQEAANLGNVNAKKELALCYLNGTGTDQNTEKAIALLEEAVKLNDADAIYDLAILYEEGELVQKDEKKAFELYKQAADLGNADAMCNLGVLYEDGSEVVQKDETKAFELYKKAANKGEPTSMYNLAECYRKGIGTTTNMPLALHYFELANKAGHKQASKKLAELKAQAQLP